MAHAAPAHRPRCVLVTGGAGFIGTNFLLRMVPNHRDWLFVNLDKLTYAGNQTNLDGIAHCSNYTFVQGDVCNPELVDTLFAVHDFTTVVHFAAESHVDRSIRAPVAFVKANTVGTVNLLEAARQQWTDRSADRRFLHVSTDEVFGALGATGQFAEDTPYDPRSPYAASKAAADHFVRAFAHTYGLPAIVSNCSNNYGPFQFPEKLIPLTIVRARDQQRIPVYGRGLNVRDWLHVEDHCAALELILEFGRVDSTYMVGGGNEVTNLSLVQRLADCVDEMLDRPQGTARQLITFVTDRPGHDFPICGRLHAPPAQSGMVSFHWLRAWESGRP